MPNPFEKFLGPEDHLHKQILDYLRLQYRNVMVAHVPNEGRRTPFERFKAKWLGISSGVPDLLIFERRGKWSGLALEVKAKGRLPGIHQQVWLNYLRDVGWRSTYVDTLDEAMKIIDSYLKV